jgi:hypothetical protein
LSGTTTTSRVARSSLVADFVSSEPNRPYAAISAGLQSRPDLVDGVERRLGGAAEP